MSSRNMSLLPRATLHSDSEQLLFQVRGFFHIEVTYNITCNMCNMCVQYEKKISLLSRF
jgi:hypothetical protein